MFIPTLSDRNLLNSIYSLIGTVDLIISPFTIFLLILPTPDYLKVFKRLQLAIVISAFLFALGFFILRPVVTVPLSIYSLSGWALTKEAIFLIFAFSAFFFGLSFLFLMTTYFHRVIVLASFELQKTLAYFYSIFTLLVFLSLLCLLGAGIYFYYTEQQYVEELRFDPIRNFSEVLIFESAGLGRLLESPLTGVAVSPIGITGFVTIFLIYKFTYRNRGRSQQTREKLDQLFRLTLIQLFFGFLCIGLPCGALYLGVVQFKVLPEICLYYTLIPITIHSSGNCIAIICTTYYRNLILRWILGNLQGNHISSIFMRDKTEKLQLQRVVVVKERTISRKTTF